MITHYVFNVLFCAFISFVYGDDSPVVDTTIGLVQGTSASDGEYFSFYGIPYGGSTAGENRFKGPTPAPILEEMFVATDDSVLCAQPSANGPIGVEDCLRLNIFTNDFTTTKPVLVWLIGEEYTTSNPVQHSFRKLVGENIVVVALNYRLSVFGFLCLGIEDAPGNAGLRDVLQGLKWIQDNISKFGGDPKNVVLFGHGSGAAMVDLITLTPLAQNLVHKAIYHSGSALSPWAVSIDPIGSAETLHNRIERNRGDDITNHRTAGRHVDNLRDLVTIFKSATVNELVNTANEIKFPNNVFLFAPCIENIELDRNNTVLHDAPINILESHASLDIPYIAGYTDTEGTIRANEAINGQWLEQMQNDFTNFLPIDLEYEEPARETMIKMIREFYFGNRIINMDLFEDYLEYHGDTMIIISVIRSVLFRTAWFRQHDARLLEFRYRGTKNSDWPFEDVALTGVPHGGILNFLLDFDLRDGDTEVMDSLIERYVNFIYTGEPTAKGIIWSWLPTSRSSPSYLILSGGDTNTEEEEQFHQQVLWYPRDRHYNFWDNLYDHFPKVPTPVSAAARTTAVSLVLLASSVLTLF